MIPRDPACIHPIRRLDHRDHDTDHETCQLCGAHTTTNRVTGKTTVEVTGR